MPETSTYIKMKVTTPSTPSYLFEVVSRDHGERSFIRLAGAVRFLDKVPSASMFDEINVLTPTTLWA